MYFQSLKYWVVGFFAGQLSGIFILPFGPRYYEGRLILLWPFLLWVFLGRIARPSLQIMLLAVFGVAGLLWGWVHAAPSPLKSLATAHVVAHSGQDASRELLVQSDGNYFAARGHAVAGNDVKVNCTGSAKFLLRRVCLVKESVLANSAHGLPSYFSPLITFKNFLIRYLEKYPTLPGNWLAGMVFGQRAALPSELTDDFKLTGTFHLLVVSGSHITLAAILLGGVVTVPIRLVYLVRGISVSSWWQLSIFLRFIAVALTWVYTWIAGYSPPVQRSILLFVVVSWCPLFIGGLPATKRWLLAAVAQACCFPMGFICESTLLSWGCYLQVCQLLSGSEISGPKRLLKILRMEINNTLLVFLCLGKFSIIGILLNPLIGLVVPIVFAGCLGLLISYDPESWIFRIGWGIQQIFIWVIQRAAEFEWQLQSWLKKMPPPTWLEVEWRLVALPVVAFSLLACLKAQSSNTAR